MNVNNGEILSLVSLPDFDPNKRKKQTLTIIHTYFNVTFTSVGKLQNFPRYLTES